MKLHAIAASAVLAAGVLGAAASAQAALVFDISYTSATICSFSQCSANPGFQPFSRTLTYQLSSVRSHLDTVSLGPGSVWQTWTAAASFGPDGESPELLAVGGFAPGVAGNFTSHWGSLHDPVDGIDLTDFVVGGGFGSFTLLPAGFISNDYGQFIRLPGDNGEVPGALSSPVDNAGFLDFLVTLGPFQAFETGSTLTLNGHSTSNEKVTYSGTATLDRAASSIPVPEPAAWTLMIAGFGLAGAALRRRASFAVAA